MKTHRSAIRLASLITILAMAMPVWAGEDEATGVFVGPSPSARELGPVRVVEVPTCPPITACFTPGEACTDAIVQALNSAQRLVLVQAYSFTSAPIAKAVLDAHTRGVQVQVILDKSQRTEKYSSADFLANHGVSVTIDAAHAIAHNKVMIIDGETVLTGSFNFTKAAQEKNAENLLIVRDPALAERYTHKWETHRAHSQVYVGRVARGRHEP